MFNFIKNLFKSKSSREKTIEVPADAKLITTELVLASFISLLNSMLSSNSFNKSYKCVTSFISTVGTVEGDLLSLDELLGVGDKELFESKIIAFAKKYTLLGCKSDNKSFDEWMHKVSSIIYKP